MKKSLTDNDDREIIKMIWFQLLVTRFEIFIKLENYNSKTFRL